MHPSEFDTPKQRGIAWVRAEADNLHKVAEAEGNPDMALVLAFIAGYDQAKANNGTILDAQRQAFTEGYEQRIQDETDLGLAGRQARQPGSP